MKGYADKRANANEVGKSRRNEVVESLVNRGHIDNHPNGALLPGGQRASARFISSILDNASQVNSLSERPK
jgi:hypothetical protein